MKILGVSNPQFRGVTVATKALCTDHCAIGNIAKNNDAYKLGVQIAQFGADVTIIGGWSKNYNEVVRGINDYRKGRLIQVSHNTMFHGNMFNDEHYFQEAEYAYRAREIDQLCVVQPQDALFKQQVEKVPVAWLPHYFRPAFREGRMQRDLLSGMKSPMFHIGILGGTKLWHKNAAGPERVIKRIQEFTKDIKLTCLENYDLQREEFRNLLKSCHLLIHISHVEAYSNVVQEAWSFGVPVIIGGSSCGLYNNPLLPDAIATVLRRWVLESSIDAIELFDAVMAARQRWVQSGMVSCDFTDTTIENIYECMYTRTKEYSDTLISQIKTLGRLPLNHPSLIKPFQQEGTYEEI